ncbi:MAG: Ig-like domain-containing protein [Lachnospiraceae bacterium]|nr:Ig-like domain-containing protein [Lachnospiraceae bacterium]
MKSGRKGDHMMKKTNFLQKFLTVTLSIVTITTSILGNCNLTAVAAETTDEAVPLTVAASDDVSTTDAEVEKELVQYADNWCIFHYLDPETDRPMFDIEYQGKSIEELESEGLYLQYRIYYKDEEFSCYTTYDWYNSTDKIPKSQIEDIEYEKDKYYIQFQIVDYSGTSISKSYTPLIWPQEEPFPYILSSNIDYCETYDLNTNSNILIVNLTYSEHLLETDTISFNISTDINQNHLEDSYSVNNLTFDNITNNIKFGEKTYTLQNCILSFSLELSKSHNSSLLGNLYVNYMVEILGLTGTLSNRESSNFIICAYTPRSHSNEYDDETIYPDSITITSPTNTVESGIKIPLAVTVSPDNTTDKTVTWISSNEDLAIVDENGIVTAKSPGVVTITAISNSDDFIKRNYTITIVEPLSKTVPVTEVKISSSSNSINAGEKVTLTADISPQNATNKTVTWSSSNEKYATVDANGVVTTKVAGAGKTVTITATAADGSNKKATFTLKIKKVSVKKVKLSGKKTVKAGKKITLKATVTPSNATNKSIKWSSSNKKYATVNQKGVVKSKKAGKGKTVKITATTKDGSKKKATFKIKIK